MSPGACGRRRRATIAHEFDTRLDRVTRLGLKSLLAGERPPAGVALASSSPPVFRGGAPESCSPGACTARLRRYPASGIRNGRLGRERSVCIRGPSSLRSLARARLVVSTMSSCRPWGKAMCSSIHAPSQVACVGRRTLPASKRPETAASRLSFEPSGRTGMIGRLVLRRSSWMADWPEALSSIRICSGW